MQSPEMMDALAKLAEQLGTTVSAIWGVARTMPAYNALRWMPWALTWALLGLVMLLLRGPARRHLESKSKDARYTWEVDFEKFTYGVTLTAPWIAAVIAALCLIAGLTNLVGLVNPDAYALEYIRAALR